MEDLHETLREIRSRLRRAMNGMISTSMREKGIVYKLNFGVPYPEIKEIAHHYQPDICLANALWREDIREFKILATLLCPPDSFPMENARRWTKEIPYLEIAEYCSKNLFAYLPYMEPFVTGLIHDTQDPFSRISAFLTCAEYFRQEKELSTIGMETFLSECLSTLVGEKTEKISWNEKQTCIQALKFYGRLSEERAHVVLDRLQSLMARSNDTPEMQEIYKDLKFEFEYYR